MTNGRRPYYEIYPPGLGSYPPIGYPPLPRRNDGFAIASLICSLVGICAGGAPLGLAGLILGLISIKRIKDKPYELKGRGMAIAGSIIGGCLVLLTIIVLFIYFFLIMSMYNT